MSWSAADIPNQQGRIALITGANSGLGLETARALKRCGATVVLACRSPRKAERAKQELLQERDGGAVDLVDLDLADLTSVQQAVATRLLRSDEASLHMARTRCRSCGGGGVRGGTEV